MACIDLQKFVSLLDMEKNKPWVQNWRVHFYGIYGD